MNKILKAAIVLALIVSAGAIIILKQDRASSTLPENNEPNTVERITQKETLNPSKEKISAPLPLLIDIGADRCIPCKLMAPILEQLKVDFKGVFKVEFIDVWKNPNAGKEYGYNNIPTQIFFDAKGKELFRHQGFYSRGDILAKWKEFGVKVDKVQEKND